MQHNVHKSTDKGGKAMRILHILNDGPTALSDQIINVHFRRCHVEAIDLTKKEVPYEDLVDKIFSCDQVISW